MTNPLEKACRAACTENGVDDYDTFVGINRCKDDNWVRNSTKAAITAFLQAVDKEKLARAIYDNVDCQPKAMNISGTIFVPEFEDCKRQLSAYAQAIINELLKQVKGE